jgi:hypothetical protein
VDVLGTGAVGAEGRVSTGVVVTGGLASTGVVVTGARVSTGVVVAAAGGLAFTGLVVVVAGSVRTGGGDVLCEPNASGWRPFVIGPAAAVLRSGAGGSATATGTRANAQARARVTLQRYLVPLPQPRRSDGTQMLTLSPPSFAVCREKARCLDAFVNPSP